MSITNIKLTQKVEVFIRLIQNNENLKDACSKAGIKVSTKSVCTANNSNS
ncbi:MAG: hypothetical protein ACNI28_07910 [Arcobacter sp.]